MRSGIAVTAVLVLGSGGLQARSAPTPALPGWLAGCWIEEKAADWTEECWTSPRAGMMLGSNRAGTGDRITMWETMQIVASRTANATAPTFYASPRGVGRTAFTWQSGNRNSVVFVNVANDYPQRIRYWRQGEMLGAEISLADGSNLVRWMFKPAR